MFKHKLLIPVIGIALTAGAIASPDDYGREAYYERRGPMPFEVMDLDGDGTISATELGQVRSDRQRVRAEQGYPMRGAGNAPSFEQIDRDGNGAIDRGELDDWHAQRMQGCCGGPGRRWDQ